MVYIPLMTQTVTKPPRKIIVSLTGPVVAKIDHIRRRGIASAHGYRMIPKSYAQLLGWLVDSHLQQEGVDPQAVGSSSAKKV